MHTLRRIATGLMLGLLFAGFVLFPVARARGDAAQNVQPEAAGGQEMCAADVARLLRGMQGIQPFSTEEELLADITKNGQINDVDIRAALWMATGQIADQVKFVERIATGLCGEELFEHFYYAGVIDDGAGNYKSPNVSVTVEQGTYSGSVYFAADVYVQDISCLATAFSKGRYRGGSAKVKTMAAENNAVLAVNGDFYSQRDMGPVIRNGATYQPRVSDYWDVCLLTMSGELLTFPYRTLTAEILNGIPVYQSWVFGPELLDETGAAKTKFRSAVTSVNPRTVVGYYAPGHYCLLVVDGRQKGYSAGLTMGQLAELCQNLNMKAAYNLDGGQSTTMATKYGLVNKPAAGGRAVSDIVYIRDLES